MKIALTIHEKRCKIPKTISGCKKWKDINIFCLHTFKLFLKMCQGVQHGNSLVVRQISPVVLLWTTYHAVPCQIKPRILNLTIRRNQSNSALSLFLLAQRKRLLSHGPRSKFSSEGAKEELVDEIWVVLCLGIFIWFP